MSREYYKLYKRVEKTEGEQCIYNTTEEREKKRRKKKRGNKKRQGKGGMQRAAPLYRPFRPNMPFTKNTPRSRKKRRKKKNEESKVASETLLTGPEAHQSEPRPPPPFLHEDISPPPLSHVPVPHKAVLQTLRRVLARQQSARRRHDLGLKSNG
jgi:hypothetical protein